MAAAVLIDATVVRGVLLPAGLALLGDRAWALPSPEGETAVSVAAARSARSARRARSERVGTDGFGQGLVT